MTEGAATPARFIRLVGWVFVVASVIGLVVSAAQTALVFGDTPGADGRARAVALGLVALSSIVLVVSVAFLKRRRWARGALGAIAVLGIVVSLTGLLVPSAAIEPPPPGAPAEYARLLRVISVANVVVPIAACVTFGWILWRLRSPAVGDQFR